MASSPSTVAALLRDVRASWTDDPEGAVDRLDRALHEAAFHGPDPEYARAHARLGQLRIFLGRLDAAIEGLAWARTRWQDPYLQLHWASATIWRGDPYERSDLSERVEAVRQDAVITRDGPLAIAADGLLGELALIEGRTDDGVLHFGRALGVSEFSTSEAMSVTPLAGLARAHARGRAPGKAPELARRALARARRAGDVAGEARALMALAEAEQRPEHFLEAAEVAASAPHRPMALAARLAALEAGVAPEDAGGVASLLDEARTMGMWDATRRLERLSSLPG